MYLLVLAAVFVSEYLVNGRFESNECTKRTPINVTLPQLDGIWYYAVIVNQSEAEDQLNCVQLKYAYNETTEMTHVLRSSIHRGKTEPETNTLDFGMISPGLIDFTNSPQIHILDRVLEYTENESLILSICQQINGTKIIDEIILMLRERSMITDDTVNRKLLSIGIGTRYNTYFRPRQTDCPN